MSIAKTKAEIQKDYERRTGHAAINKYNKEKTVTLSIRLMKNTEADLIEYIEKQQNKAGYIKKLIREDMNAKR